MYTNNHSNTHFRKAKFLETDAKIEKHNKEFASGKKSYELGHNQFSDMDEDEKKSYLGLVDSSKQERSTRSVSSSIYTSYMKRVNHFVFTRNSSVTLPTSIGIHFWTF